MKVHKHGWVIAGLAVAVCSAVFLWDTPFLYPVKLFVVLAHEISHGLAAVATGGSIIRIEVDPGIGGICHTRGGNPFVILPAGYLGSMAIGSLILIAASKFRFDRLIAALIAVVIIAIAFLYVRNLFGFAFTSGFGVVLLATALFLPAAVNDFILRLLGILSMVYAVIDIKEDLITRTVPGSDAYEFSKLLFFPPVFWGVLWSAIALVVAVLAIKIAFSARYPVHDI